jgi:luciferase family oxidoreductase group 1
VIICYCINSKLSFIRKDLSHISMKNLAQTPLSLLDLVAVREGASTAQALQTATQAAQHVERLGFARYWLAEHHNMAGVASSATAVLVGHIASQTKSIRLGSGGIMLPNHAPLVVAEAFGTLAELHPGRIELGLGRAPGTDPHTMRALRRHKLESAEDFPRDVAELMGYLAPARDGQRITANPGAGTQVPVWLLGSSLFSAQLAAQMGLPYAFASHFAPAMLLQALDVYRRTFKPSAHLAKPYAIIGVPLIAAPTDEEAQYLASSVYQRIYGILTGRRGKLPLPDANFMTHIDPAGRAAIADFLAAGVIGSPETVRDGLQSLLDQTQADEIMFVCDIHDPALRLRALDIAAQVAKEAELALA